MTSKTSKTKPKISLILNKDFIQYCELNEIEDIRKLAKETFKRGFDLLKYGNIPSGELTPQDKGIVSLKDVPPQPTNPSPYPVVETIIDVEPEKPKIVEAVPMKSSDAKEALTKMGVKTGKSDLYDE
jgi:hypothetical protein